tara:strand:+ start:1578 stop:2177 length:600 start_codon:yes stop_codon:yes gene_type:complete
MTYFLGRDLNAYIGTESAFGLHWSGTTASTAVTAAASNRTFAMPLASGVVTSTTNYAFGNLCLDLTGCDLSIGAVDEDVTYFGLRSVQKVESKKETTVSLTRKKINMDWDLTFNNGYRWGIYGSADPWDGLEEPTATHGYRLFLELKNGAEVFTVPNACIQSHTVTLNADGTADETMEFMSYVTPLLALTGSVAATTAF